jgi:prolyl oligopeptidase
VPGFDPSAFQVEQRFVPSEDGSVRIPLFLVTKAGAGGGGAGGSGAKPPVLLYAYGGFNISMQPTFSAPRLAWLHDCGGVWALAW